MSLLSSRSFLLLTGIGLVIRLAVIIYVGSSTEKIMTGDGKEFQQIAFNIVEHFSYSKSPDHPDIPDTRRTPIYPFWIAMWVALAGSNFHPVIVTLTHLVFFMITAAVIWKIGTMTFDKTIAALATGIYCFDVSSIANASFLMAESLYAMLCILCVYYSLLFIKHFKMIYIIVSGLTLGLMTLTKPMSYYFIFLMFPILIFYFVRYKSHRKTIIFSYLVFFSVYTIVITPWIVRNYSRTGIVQVSSIQDYQLLYYQAAIVKADAENISRAEAVERIRSEMHEKKYIFENDIVTTERQSLYRLKAVEIISNHWTIYLRHFIVSKFIILFDPDRFSLAAILNNQNTPGMFDTMAQMSGIMDRINNLVSHKKLFMILIINLLLLSTVLAGTLGTLKQIRKNPEWVPAIHIIIYVILLHLLMIGVTPWARFRVMYYPLMALLAAPGLYHLFNYVKIALYKKFRAD